MFDLVERSRIKCNNFWLMCLQGKRAFICACANVLLLLETELQCLSPINERNVGFKRERG